MSSTRHAEPGTELRQERWASSPEYERGLKPQLVAMRCQVLDDPKLRELIWAIQYYSWQDGGLGKFICGLIDYSAGKIGSEIMTRIGMEPNRIYNSDQVREIREQLLAVGSFLLRGEAVDDLLISVVLPVENYIRNFKIYDESQIKEIAAQAKSHPLSYPATAFTDYCLANARSMLEETLQEFCLNPKCDFQWLRKPWFHMLPECLTGYVASLSLARLNGTVTTEIGRKVHETLDYGLACGCMVLVDGQSRIGKTFAAKVWCESKPGRARYVQVSSSTDDKTFFRTLGSAIGIPEHIQYKAQQFRERVEAALKKSKLMLVMDEAHYLWGNVTPRGSMPKRIQWLMTTLVNNGVPVALVTTPQFFRSQKAVEKYTCWTSEQFTGRLDHCEILPDDLTFEDLTAVARKLLPGGDDESIRGLVAYAKLSPKYLAAIESAARRAFYLANKAGRDKPSVNDVCEAIRYGAIPSDNALFEALAGEPRSPKRTTEKPALVPISGLTQGRCNESARALHCGNRAIPARQESGRGRLDAGIENAETRRSENDFATLGVVAGTGG